MDVQTYWLVRTDPGGGPTTSSALTTSEAVRRYVAWAQETGRAVVEIRQYTLRTTSRPVTLDTLDTGPSADVQPQPTG